MFLLVTFISIAWYFAYRKNYQRKFHSSFLMIYGLDSHYFPAAYPDVYPVLNYIKE